MSFSIHTVHDDAKDKDFELEMSWVCTESKGRHEIVPQAIAAEAERLAKVFSLPLDNANNVFRHLFLKRWTRTKLFIENTSFPKIQTSSCR